MTPRPSVLACGAALLLLAAACSAPAPDGETKFDRTAEALRRCPVGDEVWREAVRVAESENRLEDLAKLAGTLADACSGAWEPVWTRGRCLLSLDRPDDAQPQFELALERAEALSDPVGVARAANSLGWLAYAEGNLGPAESLYERSLEAAIGADRLDLVSFFRNNLAGLLVAKGDYAGAREQLELAEHGLVELGLDEAAVGLAFNRAVTLLELGNATAARETLEAVYETALSIEDDWTLNAAAVVLGNLHLAVGETGNAREWHERVSGEFPELSLLAAVGLGRAALQNEQYEEARRLLDEAARRGREDEELYEGVTEVLLAEAEIRSGHVDPARSRLQRIIDDSEEATTAEAAWASRWMMGKLLLRERRYEEAARVLQRAVELLEEYGAPLDPLGDGMHYLRERSDPYADLAVALVAGTPSDSVDAAHVLEVVSRAKARALRWASADDPGGGTLPRLAGVQAGLAPGTLMLDYLIGEDRGVLLAVTSSDVRAVVLPGRRELLEPLIEYRGALRRPVETGASARSPLPEADRAVGLRLWSELVGSVEDLVAASSRLYVVPDRELALLPFAALPVPPSESGPGEPPTRYLGELVEIAVLPYAGTPPGEHGPADPVLLAGQPVLAADSPFAELPWASYELSRLRDLWTPDRSSLLTGEEFSLKGLTSRPLSRFRTIHLATHALASTRDPRECGVVLSGDERLGIDRIVELDLRSKLIVLSACRTGEGELLPGQGVIGLGWAFLRAGADGVVVSRWTVDDASSARLMVAFHRHLHDGADPVAALSQARRETLGTHPHPTFWAPFVVVLRPESAMQ